jgi:hypothetical protein
MRSIFVLVCMLIGLAAGCDSAVKYDKYGNPIAPGTDPNAPPAKSLGGGPGGDSATSAT